jgi:hypothetical protein
LKLLTIDVPDGKGGTKTITITLSKDDVGLSKEEDLNSLSQTRQTGKLKTVETQILSRIFNQFKTAGLIKLKPDEGPGSEPRGNASSKYRN